MLTIGDNGQPPRGARPCHQSGHPPLEGEGREAKRGREGEEPVARGVLAKAPTDRVAHPGPVVRPGRGLGRRRFGLIVQEGEVNEFCAKRVERVGRSGGGRSTAPA